MKIKVLNFILSSNQKLLLNLSLLLLTSKWAHFLAKMMTFWGISLGHHFSCKATTILKGYLKTY